MGREAASHARVVGCNWSFIFPLIRKNLHVCTTHATGANLLRMSDFQQQIQYLLALTLVPDIGPIITRNLVAQFGSPQAVFDTPKRHLAKMPGVSRHMANIIHQPEILRQAERELAWMEAKAIKPLQYWDADFPNRLKHCPDAPVLLFYKGNQHLNHPRMIGMVGTRNATPYGRAMCAELVAGLREYDVVVVSGLAYGIDIATHRAALEQGVPTIGVVAHGLDRIYPHQHTDTARRMMENGGVLTEFLPGNDPDRHNFPRRNRIVAGMIDALVVVESAENGGAIITAALANGYNRDVFALPGDVKNPYAKGCHKLIKTQQAMLLEQADDLATVMGWKETSRKKTQRELFVELNAEEKLIIKILSEHGEMPVDELSGRSGLSPSIQAGTLLSLELQNLVLSLPGKRYKLA